MLYLFKTIQRNKVAVNIRRVILSKQAGVVTKCIDNPVSWKPRLIRKDLCPKM